MSVISRIGWRGAQALPRWVLLTGFLLLGCSSVSGPPEPPAIGPPAPIADPGLFSAGRAWKHLTLLTTRVGERSNGSRGARRTRDYLSHQLSRVGVKSERQRQEVEWQGDTKELEHVVGVIPGASPDVILLATHYDTHDLDGQDFVGANDGGSGTALLLELARVLVREPRPYSVWLVFLDGDGIAFGAGEPRLGAQAFAQQLAEEGRLEQIRMAVFFDQVADAELSIVRDLRSHRGYREPFWDAASSLGHAAAFPRSEGFGSPRGGHEAFLALGVRPVVAVGAPPVGGPPPPGP
jgi:glutaminyl-peptide cyclotransferase